MRVEGHVQASLARHARGWRVGPHRLWKVCVAALGLIAPFIGGPALAQMGVPPPRPYQTVDARGVDLVFGSYSTEIASISVGPKLGGLSNTLRYETSGDHFFRHSVVGGINQVHSPGSSVYQYTVTVLGRAVIFTRGTTGSYTLRQGEGGTLTNTSGILTFTALDGTVAVFSTGITYSDGVSGYASVTSVTRPSGEVLTYAYNGAAGAQYLQSVTNNLGYQIHFQYGAGGDLTKVEAINNAVDPCDPYAAVCATTQTWPSLSFAISGSTTSVTDALGRTTRIIGTGAYTTGIARPTLSSGQNLTLTWQTLYDFSAAVATISDGAGTWSYAFAEPPPSDPPFSTVNTVTDPLSHVTSVAVQWLEDRPSDPVQLKRRVQSVTDPLGHVTSYAYDTKGRQTYLTQPEGDLYQWIYTGRGDLQSQIHTPKVGFGLSPVSITATYGDCSTPIRCGRPTAITDERGFVTDLTWDAAGNPLTVTRPAPSTGAVRPQTRYTWAPQYAWYKQGGSSTITQAAVPVYVQTESSACATVASCDGGLDEVQTSTAYQAGSAGAASNLLPVTVSSGSGDGLLTATTTMTYDAVRNVLTVDGPLAGTADTTRYIHDAMRQQTGVIAPDPDGAGARLFPASRTTYNADGQVVSVETGTTTGQTDPAWAAFSPLQTATTAYDAQARKIRHTAFSGSASPLVTQYSYDAAGRPTCSVVRMNPAVFGSLPASACVLGTEGSFGKDRIAYTTYDNADRPLSVTQGYLSGTTITASQTWTDNGKIATRTDGNGNLSTWVYDGLDRISRLRFPNASGGGSSTTDYEETGYDAASNVTSFRNRAGETVTNSFDALNRKTGISGPTLSARTFAYDNLNRQTGGQFTGGGAGYANAWDALGRLSSQTQSPLGTVGYQYDPAGRRTRITWPDSLYIVYDYNLDGGVSAIRENGATSGGAVLATYVYDDLGRRTSIARGNGAPSSWSYDAASRLSGLSHDPTGTAADVAFGFTYNPASQIVGRTSSNTAYQFVPTVASATYVNNGRNQVTTAGGATIAYDARFNITNTGAGVYGFNALNQMVSAKPGSAAVTALTYDPMDRLYQVGTARFLYDGAQVIAEYDSGGALTRRHAPGPGVDEVVVSYASSGVGARQYLIADERGSTIGQLSNAGASIAINTYDEYGRPAAGNTGRFQYTGQMWLSSTGVYNYKARAYDPNLGRFLQTDPVGYEAGLNLYGYVGNDPVNRTDPTGNQAVPYPSPLPIYWPPIFTYGTPENEEAARQLGWALDDAKVAVGNWWQDRLRNSPYHNEALGEDGRLSQDDKGKVHGNLPDADEIPDAGLEDSIGALEGSIGVRTEEQRRFPRGDPNGSSRERREARQRENHEERIRREEDLLGRLRGRTE